MKFFLGNVFYHTHVLTAEMTFSAEVGREDSLALGFVGVFSFSAHVFRGTVLGSFEVFAGPEVVATTFSAALSLSSPGAGGAVMNIH